jgi:hypothetical protein
MNAHHEHVVSMNRKPTAKDSHAVSSRNALPAQPHSQLTTTLQRLVECICRTQDQPARTVTLLHYVLRILSACLQPLPAPLVGSDGDDSVRYTEPRQQDGHAAILALQQHLLRCSPVSSASSGLLSQVNGDGSAAALRVAALAHRLIVSGDRYDHEMPLQTPHGDNMDLLFVFTRTHHIHTYTDSVTQNADTHTYIHHKQHTYSRTYI